MKSKPKIALLAAGLIEAYQHEVISGILKEIEKYDCTIQIFQCINGDMFTAEFDEGEYNIFSLVDYNDFDGIIAFYNTINIVESLNTLKDKIKDTNVPIISVDCEIPGTYYVGTDNLTAQKEVVDHLIEKHNFKDIGFVTGHIHNKESVERLEGYKQSLANHGIEYNEERVFYGTFNWSDGKKIVDTYTSSKLGLPRAIVCSNDHQASGVITVLHSMGVKIPEDVAVTGFDNVGKTFNDDDIMLTSVERNHQDFGKVIIPKLFELMKGNAVEKTIDYVPHSIVVGNSCSCNVCASQMVVSKPYDSDEFIKNNVYKSCRMLSNLNGAVSIKELVLKLEKWVEMLESEEFYLCLCDDWEGRVAYEGANEGDSFERFHRTYGYSKKVDCVISYKDGKFGEKTTFDVKNLLPENACTAKSQIYVYSPLHFLDRCFGYSVCVFNELEFYKKLNYTNFTHNIINALEVIRRENQLKFLVKKFNKLSMSDGLTGIYNRHGFLTVAENTVENIGNSDIEMFVAYFDLDGLKVINDTFGHEEGDIAIKALATALSDCSGREDICGRIGGDEFVYLGVGYTQVEIENFLHRVEEHINHFNSVSNNAFTVATSYGYQSFRGYENISISSYIDIADGKMYRSKYEKKKKQQTN